MNKRALLSAGDACRCDELQAKVEQMKGLVEETLIWYKTFSSDEANRRLHEAVEKYRRPDA